MARVIIGIHGLGNKPDKATLKKWWRMSMNEGLKSIGKEDTSLTKFEMVYWADVMYDKPLDKSVKDPENPYFIEEKYTKAPADFQVEDHSLRMSIIEFCSIIAYDVLTFLAPHIKIHSLVTMGSPLELPVIISKIAVEYKRKIDAKVQMITPPGVYKH
jgi:hypothetical protein